MCNSKERRTLGATERGTRQGSDLLDPGLAFSVRKFSSSCSQKNIPPPPKDVKLYRGIRNLVSATINAVVCDGHGLLFTSQLKARTAFLKENRVLDYIYENVLSLIIITIIIKCLVLKQTVEEGHNEVVREFRDWCDVITLSYRFVATPER